MLGSSVLGALLVMPVLLLARLSDARQGLPLWTGLDDEKP